MGRAQPAGERGGFTKDVTRPLWGARTAVGVAEGEEQIAAPLAIATSKLQRLERSLVQLRSLLVRQALRGVLGGGSCVAHRLLDVSGGARLEQVVGDLRQVRLEVFGEQVPDRRGDAVVEPQPAAGCEA